ncbi:phospholipase D-like domain-containing protein [Solibacillus sp. FSL W7-1436]|uniref:phospholipase D-like domain-containing protein n=1 Tax=Solibacillus sp. FSL W7-1436 TaxID=2921705 RepID=UPI0030FAA8A8
MKSNEQFSLFAIEEVKPNRFLYVVKDNEVKDMELDELFDASKFTRIRAVSFVASPKFFFKMTKDFEEIQLILGIEDGHVAGAFITGLQALLAIDERINLFQSLPEEVQERIRAERYQVRYSKKNDPIHSKIYLLDGKEDKRVMLGSANFTEQAFNQRKQYEELLVFDNSPLFELYDQRFNEIYEETVDFVPEKYKHNFIGEPINVADPDQLFEALLEEVTSGKVFTEFTEVQIEELTEASLHANSNTEQIESVRQLIEVITKKDRKTGNHIILPPAQLDKKNITIKSKLSRLNKRTEEVDTRGFIEYNDSNHLLYKKADEENMFLFSKRATKEDLNKQLKLIHAFIDAYKTYTVQSSTDTQTRIFEAILYAFMSAHIWKIRDHYVLEEGRESVRRNIPLFLVLAGRTSSGKTSALEFINLLIGNTQSYLSYEQINKKNMIVDLFYTSNVNPILVDEVDSKFFTSTAADKGERLIKDVTNNLDSKHPVFICTTNTTNFDATAQVISRIYYLQIDNTFDKQKQAESSKFLGNIMSEVNSTLYQDFTGRLADRIKHHDVFYTAEDYLFIAREIFKEYHVECELELPKWFSTQKFDDYNERGKKIWRELFISNKEAFDVRNDNTVYVRSEVLGKRTKREREEIINYLPPESILEDNTVLILNKEIFMNFINEISTKAFWRKWFSYS